MRGKFTFTILCQVLALSFAASAAMAESTFVIQLGAFPSKQEAEQKWEALKNSQPEVLGGLSMHVAEAILQPDNVTLFRTQAGPFKSKIDAQTACSKLKSSKTECFVAETAMFVPDQPATQQVASKAAEQPVNLPSLSGAQKTALAPLPLPPELPPANAAMASTTTVSAPPAPSILPPQQKEEKLAMAEAPVAAKPVEQKSDSGWFSWVPNPFSSDKEEKKKENTTVVTQAPATASAPVAAPTIAAAPVAAVQQQAAPAPLAPANANKGQTIFYAMAEPKSEGWRPWSGAAAKQQQPNTPLPPIASPPPPMGRTALATPPSPPPPPPGLNPLPPMATPAPVAPPPAVAMAEPSAPFPVTAGAKPITIRAKEAPVTKSVRDGEKAQVKVAEAIRVPLSTGKRTITSANPASFRSMPSQNLGLRSYWAQLSFFPDDHNALGFWQDFSGSRPEFSGMRVRVVKPYLTRGRAAKTSLRVGPFENTDDIAKLCNAATSRGLRCNAVSDMGSGTVANAPRDRATVPLKYQANNEEPGAIGYWVQLGTYRSAREAEETWDQLKDANSDLLKKAASKVSVPTFSSSPKAKYRLRAGPYSSEVAASNLCRKLKFRSVSCLVVSGQ